MSEDIPKRAGGERSERERVLRVYSRYRRDARKRRAWAADNRGNEAIRLELLERVVSLGQGAIAGRAGRGAILDLGCGSGWWLRALRDAGADPARLFGVDIQKRRVAAARAAVPGARVSLADARELTFGDESFDLVLLLTLLSSLDSQASVRRALTEARRVLAPGGLLLCYEPRYPNPFNRAVRRVTDDDLSAAGIQPRNETNLTLHPWLARRLGPLAPRLYSPLSWVRPLRTHRLIAYRR